MHEIFIRFFFTFFSSFLNAKTLNKVTLQLLWLDQFQFAGYYMAKQKGFYKEVGLDVTFKPFGHGVKAVDDVIQGKTTFAIGRSSLLVDKSQGKEIKLLAALFQTSPLVLMASPDANIQTLNDLKNKRIMLSPDQSTIIAIKAMLNSQRVSFNDLIQLPHSFDVRDLLNDKVDVTSAYISAQPYSLEKLGMKPIIFDPKDYGFDFYNDILYTSEQQLAQNPKQVKNFLKASLKGWKYAFENIQESVELVYKQYNLQNKSRDELLYEALELKKLAYYNTNELGKIDTVKLEKIYNVLNVLGYIEKGYEVQSVLLQKEKNDIIAFTKEEREYIKKAQPILYSEINWKPLSIIENNAMSGIMGDYLELVAQKTGLTFKYVPSHSWQEVLQKFKDKQIDLIPGIGSSPQELALGSISSKYANYPMVVVTTNKYRYINDLNELKNRVIAVPKYYTSYNFLTQNHPDIKLITTKNISEALLLVAQNKADAFVGHIATSLYYISQGHLSNLKISGTTEFKFEHHYLIQNQNPLLLSIINKAFDSITSKQRDKINARWVNTTVEQQTDYTTIVILSILFIIVLSILLYRQVILKRFNQQLQNSYESLERILDATLQALIIVKNGRCIDANKAALRLFKIASKKEILNKPLVEMLPYFQENKKEVGEQEALKQNKTPFYALVKSREVMYKNEQVNIISVVDLTSLKQKETLLIEQSKMAALGEMLGNIAHQWRQPLSVISTISSGYQLKKELNVEFDLETFAAEMEQINQNAQYLSQTIDDFRNFIKGESNNSKVELNEVLALALNIEQSVIKSNQLQIITEFCPRTELICFKNGLLQVLINIINNAKDALLNNEETNRLVHIQTKVLTKKVSIQITDNGKGIAKEILDNIFEPYFTTKHESKGTGLGLYMSYNIINKMGGSIKAKNGTFVYEDEVYKGAQFIIKLPLNSFVE
jgi:signal transduction histidine kinase/ABC-type nitrate/sulfonate/bicarbonate transport system substrate-binding protein